MKKILFVGCFLMNLCLYASSSQIVVSKSQDLELIVKKLELQHEIVLKLIEINKVQFNNEIEILNKKLQLLELQLLQKSYEK